jgi:hypothetical protein
MSSRPLLQQLFLFTNAASFSNRPFFTTTLSFLSFRAKPRNLRCASIPPRFPRATLPPIPTDPISPPTPLFLSPDTFYSFRAKATCPGVPWSKSGSALQRSATMNCHAHARPSVRQKRNIAGVQPRSSLPFPGSSDYHGRSHLRLHCSK